MTPAPSNVVQLRIAECFAVINGERDRMRSIWEDQATVKDRRLLLAMAGCNAVTAGRNVGRDWCEIPPELRADIALGLRRWKGWAEKLT